MVARKSTQTTINTDKTVAIRSLYDSRLRYVGTSTGKDYEWSRGGDVVMVNILDVPALLEKRIGERSCCGARQGGNQVFELVQQEAQ